jgi:hypothetical protein
VVVPCTQTLRPLNSACFTAPGLLRWDGSLKTDRPQSHHRAVRYHEPQRGDDTYHRCQPCIFGRLTLGEIVRLPRTLERFHVPVSQFDFV